MDAFHDNASEFDRWQSIEREVWGDGETIETEALTKKEKRAQKKQREVAVAAEDRSGGPLLVVFFFGLGFFALMYWILVLRVPEEVGVPEAKSGAAPVARIVEAATPSTCGPLEVLVGNERYVAVEAEVADYLAASQTDVDAIAELRTADADVAKLAGPLEFRAQIALVAAGQVQEGAITVADLRNQIAPLDEQVNGAVAALGLSKDQNCS